MNPNFRSNRFFDSVCGAINLMWSQLKPASREGLDATLIRAYNLSGNPLIAQIEVPEGFEVKLLSRPDGNGGEIQYFDVQVGSVHLYCYGFEPKAGSMITAAATVCCRRWEPEGAEERTDGRTCYRNDEIFIECQKTDELAHCEIVVYDTASKDYRGRAHRDMVGDEGNFAHTSGDFKRHYHVQVRPLNSADRRPRRKPAMAEALQAAGIK